MRSLTQIVGNSHLIRLLDRSGLPPASLFWGPEGVGKKTIAWSLAARQSCSSGTADLCGACGSCLKAASRNHPDIVVIDAPWIESFLKNRNKRFNPQVIPIDVVRELIREAQYRPYEAKKRYFIIDEAEKLNEAAANSLLKTLEEPSETTHIVLVTAHPEELLPTVRSRCQSFQFKGLSRTELQECLARTTDLDDIELRSALAQGSIGQALSLDLDAMRERRAAVFELLKDWLDRPHFETIFRHTEGVFGADIRKRDKVRYLLSLLRLLCEDLYFLDVGTPERLVNRDLETKLQRIAQTHSLESIPSLLYHIDKADRDVARYVNPMICFETLWIEAVDAGNSYGSV